VTNITVIDITGGILTSIGMLFAGVTASMQRKKITNGFYEEVKKGRENMQSALENKLSLYVSTIKNRIGENFSTLDAMLANESKDLEAIDTRFDEIETRLKGLDAELEVRS
jgi:archaellum component FlaC